MLFHTSCLENLLLSEGKVHIAKMHDNFKENEIRMPGTQGNREGVEGSKFQRPRASWPPCKL